GSPRLHTGSHAAGIRPPNGWKWPSGSRVRFARSRTGSLASPKDWSLAARNEGRGGVVLRLRRLLVGCALGWAGAAAALGLVASLNFAYQAPALHVALETTAAIAASAAAFLLLGRFWRTGFLDELILSAGLAVLAVWNFAFATVPAVFDLQSSRT